MEVNDSDLPTFDKQMDKYSEGETHPDDPIFSTAYRKWMKEILLTRDESVKNELKSCVAEVLKPWHEKLDTIIANQESQSLDLAYLKDMAKENRIRIETLENVVDVHNRVLEGHNTLLKRLNITKRIELGMWVALVLSVITACAFLFHII